MTKLEIEYKFTNAKNQIYAAIVGKTIFIRIINYITFINVN